MGDAGGREPPMLVAGGDGGREPPMLEDCPPCGESAPPGDDRTGGVRDMLTLPRGLPVVALLAAMDRSVTAAPSAAFAVHAQDRTCN